MLSFLWDQTILVEAPFLLWTNIFHFSYLSITIKGLSKKRLELGHRTKNEVITQTQHCTASHSITLPYSTTTWYSSTMTHRLSHAQTFYLQRDTNTRSYKNPVHNTTWSPAKCWSILLLQQHILVSHLWSFPFRLSSCVWAMKPKKHLGLDVDNSHCHIVTAYSSMHDQAHHSFNNIKKRKFLCFYPFSLNVPLNTSYWKNTATLLLGFQAEVGIFWGLLRLLSQVGLTTYHHMPTPFWAPSEQA